MTLEAVDFASAGAPKAFFRSLKETGFGVLKNHPISADAMDEVYAQWKTFFDKPDLQKRKHRFDPQTQVGYFPFEQERAKGADVPDLKEFFHIYKAQDVPDGLGEAIWTLRQALVDVALKLLNWIESELPKDVAAQLPQPLVSMVDPKGQTLFRIIHYPPLSKDKPQGAVRAAAHEDINFITLLLAATEPGLEVKTASGAFVPVPCEKGQLVVNVGDMLQEVTQGHLTSTTHRVVNPDGDAHKSLSRMSMPLFLHPKPEVVLSDRYTAASYLDERLREIGIRKNEN